MAGCDICSAFFWKAKKSIFKRMMQGALKVQGLKDLGNGLLSKDQNLLATVYYFTLEIIFVGFTD